MTTTTIACHLCGRVDTFRVVLKGSCCKQSTLDDPPAGSSSRRLGKSEEADRERRRQRQQAKLSENFFFPKSKPKSYTYGRLNELCRPARTADRGKLSSKTSSNMLSFKGSTNWALYNSAQVPGPGAYEPHKRPSIRVCTCGGVIVVPWSMPTYLQ